jgi:hypothetical protein
MSEMERKEMEKAIKRYAKKIKDNPSESTKFLNRLGMLTATGKLKREFQCIPNDQA